MFKLKYHIGDVFEIDFPHGIGSVQGGKRPAIIFQNNLGNWHSPNLVVIPLTSKIKKTNQVTHVILDKNLGLPQTSMALCENVTTVSKSSVGQYLTSLPYDVMKKITKANLLATAGVAFLQPQDLKSIIYQAQKINSATCCSA